jgi:hypothetical protein
MSTIAMLNSWRNSSESKMPTPPAAHDWMKRWNSNANSVAVTTAPTALLSSL